MVSRQHVPETCLTFAALVCVILFIVLHIITGTGDQVWWLLAISTVLLALSDLIIRYKR